MLTITVELLAGVYHADPDGSAVLGRAVRGEWPPAPARLLAAFVAADGTREETTATTGAELELLAAAPPPIIYADPNPLHNSIVNRFVVAQDSKSGAVQEYVGRHATLKRSGVQVSPRCRTVQFVYTCDVPEQDLAALQYRAARIGYLGCSDSPTRVTVTTGPLAPQGDVARFSPDVRGRWRVNTHRAGDVARWVLLYEESKKHHTQRGHHQGLRHITLYGTDADDQEESRENTERPVVLWFRFDSPVPGRRVVLVARTLKAAVVAEYSRLHTTPVPGVLHGHMKGTGYELVRFLPLPNVGNQHSDGRIHGAAVWIPPAVGVGETARLERAASAVRRIKILGVSTVRTELWDAEERATRWPWAANPGRWNHRPGSSLTEQWWATAFPIVLERHGHFTIDALDRMSKHAGLPNVVSYYKSRMPFIPGGLRIDPSETIRHGKDQFRPFFHFVLRFAVPVEGPVVLGSARARGLGLCAPVGSEHVPTFETNVR